MTFHFPKATFYILLTPLTYGGKQRQRMALVVVCRTLSPILMHVPLYQCVAVPSNYFQLVDTEPLFKAKALYDCVSLPASSSE